MSRYFDDFSDEIMHYGVKGMKWRHRKAAPTYSNAHVSRLRPRQRRVTAGNGEGVWRADEKVNDEHNTRPEDRANRGLSDSEKLAQLQLQARMLAERKRKGKRKMARNHINNIIQRI